MGKDRRQHKRSLGHRDKQRGKKEAMAVATQLINHRDSVEAGRVTLGTLINIYLSEGLHGRTPQYRREVHRKLNLWLTFLGVDRLVESLDSTDVDQFVDARRRGTIPSGRSARKTLSNTTIWHDFVALDTALNFATRRRDGLGRRLIESNPLRDVQVKKAVSPKRPIADTDVYAALRTVAPALHPQFLLALDLAFETGHRIGAILKLEWGDISFAAKSAAPFGAIRWRAENDKVGNEHVVPLSHAAREALLAAQAQASLSRWVFPSAGDPDKPLDRRLASRWFRRAEHLALGGHVQGRGWHSLRRGWASARKHLPDVDVQVAGGWKGLATMKACYQHADEAGVLRAVLEPQSRRVG